MGQAHFSRTPRGRVIFRGSRPLHPLPLLRAALVVALVAGSGGCRGGSTRAPYAGASPPAPELLLSAAAPQLKSIRVPGAKIRLNRSIAGNLMILAQAPDRFAGSIQVSGKELISLGFHEAGYALRYVAGEGLPIGYYNGPPSACAIQELLGVPMAPQEVIALILGGAPLLPEPREVVDQHWDRREGHEVLRLRTRDFVEEVTFEWLGDRWWASGATLWRRLGDGGSLWLWSIAHEGPHAVDGHTMPSRTVITRPDGRKKLKVTITYNRQEGDPVFDAPGDDTGWDDGGSWEGEEGDATTEGGDDGWEESGDGEAPEAGATEGPASSEGASATASAGSGAPAGTPAKTVGAKPPPARTKPAIPAVFIVQGDGLPVRGDLCRSR